MNSIQLTPFTTAEFDAFISCIDSEELLVTIAGHVFSYPLTHEQLSTYLADTNSHSFNIVDANTQQVIGHAEIVVSSPGLYKIDKLLIGDPASRGKGIGQSVMLALLEHAFTLLNAEKVELNVFDWNAAGIRCYEKCGFINNPLKQASFQVGDKNWTALNMTIDKQDWLKQKDTNNNIHQPL